MIAQGALLWPQYLASVVELNAGRRVRPPRPVSERDLRIPVNVFIMYMYVCTYVYEGTDVTYIRTDRQTEPRINHHDNTKPDKSFYSANLIIH